VAVSCTGKTGVAEGYNFADLTAGILHSLKSNRTLPSSSGVDTAIKTTSELCDEAAKLWDASPFTTHENTEKFMAECFDFTATALNSAPDQAGILNDIIREIMIASGLPMADLSSSDTSSDFRDEVIRTLTLLKNPKATEKEFYVKVHLLADELFKRLPTPSIDSYTFSSSPIIEIMRSPHEYISGIIKIVLGDFSEAVPLLVPLRDKIFENLLAVSQITAEQAENTKLIVHPSEKSSVEELLRYVSGTGFHDILKTEMEFKVPSSIRFEHTHIVGGTGHGKTQAIQNFLTADIAAMLEKNMSIIVIDSQGDLIDNVSRLAIFGPRGKLHDKLVLIDPKDIEYPVCLNLFQVPTERLNSYSPLIREQTVNGIIEMFDFVFGALLGAEMTSKQASLFRYVTRLLMVIPNATIHTLLDVMQDDTHDKYSKYFSQLPPTIRLFFETDFLNGEYNHTKKEVRRRLWTILENQTFERMMSNPVSKLDLFTEMNSGKIILISTAKDLLKQQGTEVLGRFFIALIIQAALERAAIPENERVPCYVYIDECQDYVDDNIKLILEQARKYKIAVILSHQELGQIPVNVLKSIHSNTHTKIVGGLSASDSRAMAAEMRTSQAVIDSHNKGQFALSVKGHGIVTFEPEFGRLEGIERVDDEEWQHFLEKNRSKYASATVLKLKIDELLPPLSDIDEHPTDAGELSSDWGRDA
jgi:hypothetical protein